MKYIKILVLASLLAFGVMSCVKPDEREVLTVEITAEEPVAFEASETKTIDFTIKGAPSKCETTVTVPEGWTARVSAMTRGNANTFNGKVVVKAPALSEDSEGELVIEVNMPEAGEMASASLKISAKHAPDQSVSITVQESVALEAASSVEIPFTVREEITRDLEVKTTTLASGWIIEVKEFNAVEGGYDGLLKVTSPAVTSNTVIGIHVMEKGQEQYLASASLKASCIAPETSVTLKIATENLTIAPGKTKSVDFTVVTLSEQALTAEVVVNEAAWTATVGSFVKDGLNYKGTLAITAPSSNSTAIATLNILNASSEKVATGVVNLSASSLEVTFDQPTTNYSASKDYEIGFTTSYTGKLSASAVVTGRAAKVKGVTVGLGEDSKSSVGTIKLWTGECADNLTLTLKLTDEEDKSVSTFNLDLKVAGGRAVPASKTASNCIVVDKTGPVTFPACKGDGTLINGAKAVLVWKDAENLFDEATLKYNGSTISFNTKSTFVAGNAVVAVVDASNNVLWSWHLWFVQGLNLTAASGSFMNMNLGATSSDRVGEAFGLFYQWGRKDPFPGPKDFTSDAENAESAFSGKNDHPTIMGEGFAWGTTGAIKFKNYDELAKYPTKMVNSTTNLPSSASAAMWGPETDPCPLGWRLPNHYELAEHWSCYSENPANTNSGKSQYGYGTSPKNFSTEWWPAPGCRMVSTGGQDWAGALRLTNYSGKYWTCTSSHAVSEYDSEDYIQELGYTTAEHVAWSATYYISLGTWQKNHAISVRCIKE